MIETKYSFIDNKFNNKGMSLKSSQNDINLIHSESINKNKILNEFVNNVTSLNDFNNNTKISFVKINELDKSAIIEEEK